MNWMTDLVPPGDPVTKWRMVVAFLIVALMGEMFLGRGVPPQFGRFAYASDADKDRAALSAMSQANSSKIDRMLKLTIAQTLRDLQAEYCKANGNKYVIQQAITDYQEDYKQLNANIPYPLQPCH